MAIPLRDNLNKKVFQRFYQPKKVFLSEINIAHLDYGDAYLCDVPIIPAELTFLLYSLDEPDCSLHVTSKARRESIPQLL